MINIFRIVQLGEYGRYKGYKGIGRKPLPRLVPYLDLKYAQVCKKQEKGHVVEVVQRIVFGEPEDVLRLLDADSGGNINTSYADRLNLTFRNALARFIRKDRHMHSRAIDYLHAWYNFVKPWTAPSKWTTSQAMVHYEGNIWEK